MNRIRELRKQKDMTQKELAKHLQVSDSTLSYWEMGKYDPDNDALMRLSRFFHVPIDYILGGDFTQWDVSGSKTPYPDADSSRLPVSDMSVSEPKVEYNTNDRNKSCIGLATVGSKLYASEKSSTSAALQHAAKTNSTYIPLSSQVSFDRSEFKGLTHEEIDLIAEYAEFIKSRRKK